ncbi:MAG TPA: ABC transporter permease subunit [Anaerolineales bacterium]|nr:ABC transporter permease subunit [Anaerolineales bacterium]
MSEEIVTEAIEPNPAAPAPARGGVVARLQGWLLGNPVTLKELRGRMRGRRAYILITAYTAVLALAMILVYFATANATSPNNLDSLRTVGKALFASVFILQLLAVCFIAPALSAGAIATERERQTYELLRTTLLSAPRLVRGKFTSGLFFLLLLLLVGLPLQSVAYLFGGVTLEELLVGILVLVVTAIAFLAIGLFFSSLARRTLVATVLAYGASLLLVFGLPLLILVITLMQNNLFTGFSTSSGYQAAFLMVLMWIVICINPLAAAIGSEVVLMENDSLWSMTQTFTGVSLTLPSPWYVYSIVYILLSLLLLWLTVRRVSHPDR